MDKTTATTAVVITGASLYTISSGLATQLMMPCRVGAASFHRFPVHNLSGTDAMFYWLDVYPEFKKRLLTQGRCVGE